MPILSLPDTFRAWPILAGLQIVNDAFPSVTVIGALAEANHPLAQVTMESS
jgi:hypothetical protein